MADQRDVRAIASALPGAVEGDDHLGFSVMVKHKPKGFAWAWRERVDPRKPRVANLGVLAVRVANELEKAALLDVDPAKFFTEPHYNGYPAVLVRLAAVSVAELREVLTQAWRCTASPAEVAAFDGAPPPKQKPARQPAANKPAANKPAAKKPAANKPAATKPAATKPAARKPAAQRRG
jgi:hypothetical protein